MFQSIGPGEIFFIGFVALIVFGPHRLPDMARRLGGYVKDLRAAALEIKSGLDAEVQQLREPLDEVKKDLTKPVTEIKQTLSETADAIKKSTEATTASVKRSVDEVRAAGNVQWVGAEPKTGVAPDEAWDGMKDSVPESIANAPAENIDAAEQTEQAQDGP